MKHPGSSGSWKQLGGYFAPVIGVNVGVWIWLNVKKSEKGIWVRGVDVVAVGGEEVRIGPVSDRQLCLEDSGPARRRTR